MRSRGHEDSTGMAPIGGSAIHTIHCSVLRAFAARPPPREALIPRLMATKTRNRMKRTGVIPHPSVSCLSCFRGSTSVLGGGRTFDMRPETTTF